MNDLMKVFILIVGVAFFMLLLYIVTGLAPWILALGALIISVVGTMSFILVLRNKKGWKHMRDPDKIHSHD